MGDVNGPIAITGAAGFIGRQVVKYARKNGVEIRALVRTSNACPIAWAEDDGITVFADDLSDSTSLPMDLDGVGAVIHCAAAMTGDHARDTHAASQSLIDAVVAAKVTHVVLAGSISVYDVRTLTDNASLSEDTPVGTKYRDAYGRAKLAQEEMFRAAANTHGFALSVLRLGAVWGPDRLFNGHIGPAFGPLLIRLDGGGQVPLCQVDLAAQCLVRAAGRPEAIQTLNIVDDDLPSRAQFVAQSRASGWPKIALPLPLGAMRLLANITPDCPQMPGLLRRAVLEARHKPLRYDNGQMHNRLGPVTMMPFEIAMQNAIRIEQDLRQ